MTINNSTIQVSGVRAYFECLLAPGAKLPVRAHPTDAGADLFALENMVVEPGQLKKVDTGVAIKIPVGYGGFIMPRSSQRSKSIHSYGDGLIDSDYRGNLIVLVKNDGTEPYAIVAGETRIAQLVISPVMLWPFRDVWNDTERGTGGFGSTNK